MPADRALRRHAPRGVAALLATTLLVAGCSEGATLSLDDREPTTTPSGSQVTSYVALGDSFTAAPFVPTTDVADGCFRSDGNYPSLLGVELEPRRFVDVSCGAATISDLTSPQETLGGATVPAQLKPVGRGTDLVTVGIGANDEGLFSNLVTRCTGTAARTQCTDALLSQSRSALTRTRARLTRALRTVQQRAPGATVMLVGYPRLADPAAPCPQFPVPRGRLADLADLEARLARVMRDAAEATDVEYVDMHAASVGHEICSDDPWVQGRRTDQDAALAYHPFAAEQEAVAEQALALLRQQDAS